MSGGIPFPEEPYVPGQTPRHPEGWFNPMKRDAAQLEHSTAMRAGLAYFESGYFWECHEMMEAIWMVARDDSPERQMAQAILQLANARLKLRMDRPKAARRLCAMVEGLLLGLPERPPPLGQSPAAWRAEAEKTAHAAERPDLQ